MPATNDTTRAHVTAWWPPPVSTRGMTYVPAEHKLVTEASDLFAVGAATPSHLTVRSARTGATRNFAHESTQLDDGEVISWTFRCAEDSQMVLVILND